ncbi:MAG TPA: TIM barrel protein [Candidatus Bathyarchaeia archaeon]|nr:TIM barrel protein [Candidatus Bathyarchaeia archaeon]
MPKKLELRLGVKTDPVQYRYSYPWLFRFLADRGVEYVQLGTFFEIYQLPDSWFITLRADAHDCGIRISSVFTAHRELGGFFYDSPEFEAVVRTNFKRLIEVGALVGADCVGSSAGAAPRDRLDLKDRGISGYLAHMKGMMAYAHARGLRALTIEPMSCLAEPPTTPDEIRAMAGELEEHNRAHADTVPVRYCTDIAHGYADAGGNVVHTHMEVLEASLPWLEELHLKNTDGIFQSTFGFSEADRARGIVQVPDVVRLLEEKADVIPVDTLIGYLEIGGPKLGRDYSDQLLETQLRESLDYVKEAFKVKETFQC